MKKILITGGCGFIGSHLTDRLVEEGYQVTVYDLLEPQVHLGNKPSYLNKGAHYIFADVRQKSLLKKSIKNIDVIFHLAAQVGVGQSMYEIEKYVSHNSLGTACLLNLLVNTKNSVKKLIVASSMSIYGEGKYRCKKCGIVYPRLRKVQQMEKKQWQMHCPKCSRTVKDLPTNEDKPLFPTSIYATTKRSQEEMCMQIGIAYKIPTVALRYFNVYGPRQSLSNPYTGVAAIFLSRVKNNKPPLIFEDGKQSRDFIYVSDIVDACILAMKKEKADYNSFNVGTGKANSILDIANTIISVSGQDFKPKILNTFRAGDIRHCYADSSKISKKLSFRPRVFIRLGMKKLIQWGQTQEAIDLTRKAQAVLKKRGLAS